jgi:hypothetical protein
MPLACRSRRFAALMANDWARAQVRVLRVRGMVIIQQQGGFRTSYDPETGKLVRIELWERPEKRPQYSLETWPDAESAEKAFWARDIKWQK